MEIGICTIPLKQLGEKVAKMFQEGGIRTIEIDSLFLLEKDKREIEKWSQDFKERNITIHSAHAPFGEKEYDLSSPEKKNRDSALSIHTEVIEKMNIIGTRCLVIHPGSKVEKVEDISVREEIFKSSLDTLLSKAEKMEVKLAIENMLPLHPGCKTELLKKILDEFSSPYLGVCFDTGHANVVSEVEEEFSIVQEEIITFHIHDNDGTRDMHLQPPYGDINWERFFGLVKTSPYKGPLMVEALPWKGREISWMKREVELLKDGKLLQGTSSSKHFLRCIACGHFIYEIKKEPICYCLKDRLKE